MKCIWAWAQTYVHFDGTIRPCCGLAPDLILGHLDSVSPSTAFMSTQAITLRQSMMEGTLPLPCQQCPNLPRLGDINNIGDLYHLNLDNSNVPHDDAAVKNYKTIEKSFAEGSQTDDMKPVAIIFSLGDRCNLRCIMCPQDHDNQSQLTDMQIEKLKESLETCLFLTFSGGEPTAYKEFYQLIDHYQTISSAAATVALLTNAQLLTKDIIERYFHKFHNVTFGINMDASNRKTYEYIRKHGKWDLLMENIRNINEYKNKHHKNWNMNMGFTIMKSNIDEMKDAIKLAGSLDMGFGCGPVSGDHYPIRLARTYLNENLFTFGHAGYAKNEIECKLRSALDSVHYLKEQHRKGAIDNILGTIEYVRTIEQFNIEDHLLRSMMEYDDVKLSRLIYNTIYGCVPLSQDGLKAFDIKYETDKQNEIEDRKPILKRKINRRFINRAAVSLKNRINHLLGR